MKAKCLHCGCAFPLEAICCDANGWYISCEQCGGSFDIEPVLDNSIKLIDKDMKCGKCGSYNTAQLIKGEWKLVCNNCGNKAVPSEELEQTMKYAKIVELVKPDPDYVEVDVGEPTANLKPDITYFGKNIDADAACVMARVTDKYFYIGLVWLNEDNELALNEGVLRVSRESVKDKTIEEAYIFISDFENGDSDIEIDPADVGFIGRGEYDSFAEAIFAEHIKSNGVKKKIKIPVTWEMCGVVEIEADSAEQALEIFLRDQEHIPLPKDSSYVDGSFGLTDNSEDFVENYNVVNKGV